MTLPPAAGEQRDSRQNCSADLEASTEAASGSKPSASAAEGTRARSHSRHPQLLLSNSAPRLLSFTLNIVNTLHWGKKSIVRLSRTSHEQEQEQTRGATPMPRHSSPPNDTSLLDIRGSAVHFNSTTHSATAHPWQGPITAFTAQPFPEMQKA
ncbi:hypothetical protein VOLCADRAFT_99584 [Volvox carteri f. nagariensis]|uniref:Uncharacterized protein n=1 Tax=Volvox carteri f. nagariensis TaxID=3068 RepID=D8UI41_VOLCA|nr:uncharacterized protein VOLCADRAFT_99584 [Volvox carteri f. nagariensis]EFJ40608.1 hypothetical protein VOLCADRAFT_99584 [Volvox carteri f. nagariensis]|eukprot:XP_002958315.1 hypothetical protein VOLCADRAFT_99584 [Volvox carteri f. nagariensis]